MGVTVDVAYKSLNKFNEVLCGDKVELLQTENSNIMILADGMGSGVKANILATLTSKILGTMFLNGATLEECVETIVETLGDYGTQIKDTDMLTEYVRQALKRTISHRFSEAGQMKVLSLDDKIENMIMSSVKKVDTGSYLALEPSAIQNIVASATGEINKIKDLVNVPIVLTSPVVRIYFKKLIDQFYPNVTVVSFSEIDNNIQIQALGNIALGQR